MYFVVLCIFGVLGWSTAANCPNGNPIYQSGGAQQDAQFIVELHNYYRQQIANGKVPGQPKASNMKKMYWDSTLSNAAQKVANSCVFAHNIEGDSRFQVGQNLYTSWSTAFQLGADWRAAVKSWFDEVYQYQFGTDEYNHYTQVVWADTYLVGCGYTMFKSSGNFPYQKLYVCNYGPAGNWVGETPYKVGKGCENLC